VWKGSVDVKGEREVCVERWCGCGRKKGVCGKVVVGVEGRKEVVGIVVC